MRRLLWALMVGVAVMYAADGEPSTEGKLFVVAIPPPRSRYEHHVMEVTFTSHHRDTQVNITALNMTDSLYLTAGSTATREYGLEWHALIGQHPTAIYVTSEEPITVSCDGATYSTKAPDASLVQPWRATSTEFLGIGVAEDIVYMCDAYYMENLGAYYMIAAYEDNTNVTVWRRSGETWDIIEQLVLHLYDVYTYSGGFSSSQIEIIVESSKPIALTNGHACHLLYGTRTSHSDRCNVQETMPSTADLGSRFVTNPILTRDDDDAYVVRVMAATNNTIVTIPGMYSETIHRGDIVEIDGKHYTGWFSHTPILIVCSKPCLAVQYTRGSTDSGQSMLVLTPVTSYSRSLVFHPPLGPSVRYRAITLITSKFPPGDIYLNNTNLKYRSWESVHEEYGVLTLPNEIEHDLYHLYSADPTMTFGAYYHEAVPSPMVARSLNLGYGIQYFEPVTTTTTTPAPIASPPPPQSRLELTGSFHSGEDQEDFTQECMQSYQDSFTQKAATVLIDVNTKLGEELCERLHHEDIELHLSGTLLFADGSAGSSQVNYLVQSEGHVVIQDFLDCVDELKEHLESFSNWAPLPIIPPEPGCPPPIFEPEAFKANEDHQWICLSMNDDENTEVYTNEPVYRVHISTDFTVADGTLDMSCTSGYSNNWQIEVQDMASDVTAQIDSRDICTAQSGMVALKPATGNFLSLGDHGTISAVFSIEASSPEAMFDDLWLCAGDVFEAVEKHEDWPSSPIIPQPVGCPLLQYEELFMTHDGEHWFC